MTKNSDRTFVHICVVISTMDLQLPQTNMTGVAIIGNNDQLENYWTTYRMYMCVCQQQQSTQYSKFRIQWQFHCLISWLLTQ